MTQCRAFTVLFIAMSLLCLVSFERSAQAQSLGFGFGLGLPLMPYVVHELGREYRVQPQSGYYPHLSERTNAMGSTHFHANLLLNADFMPIFDTLELHFEAARFLWSESIITHASCVPIDLSHGQVNDATTRYLALDKIPPECFDTKNYEARRSISQDDLSSLWFFHINVGARYHIIDNKDWKLFVGPQVGFSIATFFEDQSYFGANLSAIVGASYKLSPLVSIELVSKLLFVVTEVPGNKQQRMNHMAQTGGNIFSSLMQPYAYIDFQIGIHIDLGQLIDD